MIIGIPVMVVMLFFILRGNLYESAFSILGWVKNVSGKQVNIEDIYTAEKMPPDHSTWDKLLIKYVSKEGWVNYQGFQNSRNKLGEYLNILASHPPAHSWSQEEELAYWINAYNAFTLQLILDHYPVNSIQDIGGSIPMVNSPWDIKFFKVGDVLLDLNTIEHDILRKKIGDPRIHFAINCASISCPVLRNEAYTPEKIHQQLDEQAVRFINDETRNKLSETALQLSPIFNWFRSDFEMDQTLTQYLNQFTGTRISPNAKVEWLEYDWALNEVDQ
jgi:hypothetical protein